MGLFDTPALRGLKREAELIGTLYAQAHTGSLSEADRDDALQNEDIRVRLRQAYEAASKDAGESLALKAAEKSARDKCGAICYASSHGGGPANYYDAERAAERAIREILAANVSDGGTGSAIGSPDLETSRRSALTTNDSRQVTPEVPDTVGRLFRLYVECERRLAHDPLVQKFACGHMVGRGSGLDSLVSKIAPLFRQEQSLIRWVALRGAVASLWMSILGLERSAKSPEEAAGVMGFTWVESSGRSYTENSEVFVTSKDAPGQLVGPLRKAATEIADMVIRYAVNYGRFVDMSIYDASADPSFTQMNDAIALDCIAWTAVARLRLGIAQPMFAKVQEPDFLPMRGWYIEPVTSVCERYWDGWDWTPVCRAQGDDRFKEFNLPLRPRRRSDSGGTMGLFRRVARVGDSAQRYDGPTVADLERFGRQMYDQASSQWPEAGTEFVVPMYHRYRASPDVFLEGLADIAERHGGWAAYGAERLMIEVAGGDLKQPAYGRIMDASLVFLRARGVPPMRVTGYEWSHWIESGGTNETWVPRSPTPTETQAPITCLDIGEMRRLVQLTAESWSNVFLVRHDPSGQYIWIVDARWSDEDPRRTQSVHLTAGSLHELYVRIGLSLQVPPFWCDAELEPYIPLPRPAL